MKTLIYLSLTFLFTAQVSAQNWVQQNSSSLNDFNTIFATSNTRVHVFGDSADVFGGFALGAQFVTTNQGFSWSFSPLNSIVYTAKESFFINSSVGFVVGKNQLSGNGYIIKTVNGGLTWGEGVPHVEKLEGIEFENLNLGYAVGRNDYVVRTIDGGVNWIDVSSNTGENILGVSFTNTKNGYIVGKNGAIAHTIDSAATWVNQNSNTPEHLESVFFVNDSTGWAVGFAGAIVFTSDSGTTWTNQNSGTGEDLLDVEFVNDSTGWAVGTLGTVLITNDRGITWTAQTSGTVEDIFSITMINDQRGWFCGKNGTLFIYTIVTPNSIEEFSSTFSASVYPNPFGDYTTLKIDGAKNSPITVSILDINGKFIKRFRTTGGSNTIIRKDNLNAGIYFLQIQSENSVKTQKLIIE